LPEYQVLDLFSGPGGLGTGFSRYFPVVNAIDWNRDCCKTYHHNHREARVNCKDVRDVTYVRRDFEGILIVIGGPPCQSFTILNKGRNPRDNRANLLFEMFRAFKEIRPEFGLIENVATVPGRTKLRIKKMIEQLGYNVVSRVVRAADYGSVQIRRRWMLTACLKGHVFPKRQPARRKAREILTSEQSEISAKPETIEKIQNLPVGRWVALPGQRYKAYFIIDPDALLPAIVNPTKLRYVKPDRSGYLSITELKKAQGFPATYRFFGTLSSVGQQLANAVPVELAEAFARSFSGRLNS